LIREYTVNLPFSKAILNDLSTDAGTSLDCCSFFLRSIFLSWRQQEMTNRWRHSLWLRIYPVKISSTAKIGKEMNGNKMKAYNRTALIINCGLIIEIQPE
jgi:hypothetical protein